VLEVTKDGKIVWSIDQEELPGIKLFWVTTLQALPNGHIIVGNTHAGPNNPQYIEVTRDKKVVGRSTATISAATISWSARCWTRKAP
jgi:hypothetical protein